MKSSDHVFNSIGKLALGTALVLLLPLLAMQMSNEVNWTLSDFIIAGILLFGTGLTYILITRSADTVIYRLAVGMALGTGLFLIWTNLAVGLVGSEDNSFNMIYFGVLAVGIIGALNSKFRPHGMKQALYATALAQALVAVIALASDMSQVSGSSAIEIVGVNAFFIILFVLSALLFRNAAGKQPSSS